MPLYDRAKRRGRAWAVVTAVTALGLGCDAAPGEAQDAREAGARPLPSVASDPVRDSVYRAASEAAWAYLTEYRQESTGLVQATQGWGHLTTWDLGSLLAGVHAAGELGLASASETEAWLGRILQTLESAQLFDGIAFNKTYVAATARMVDRNDKPSDTGVGWSALDLGRLLIWLRIIADEHPSLMEPVKRVVNRIDMDRIVRDGMIHGEDLGPAGERRVYTEGRLGYEQYAARGYALWGASPGRSMNLYENADSVEVLGHTILVDRRGRNKLTSEPFILSGMELGWGPELRALSETVLAVQKARFDDTGIVTVVSEDAIERPPHYFYYYTLYDEGEAFAIRAHSPIEGQGPRWVSSKAAYAWHALLPGDYTWKAVQTVAPARSDRGWSSGVFENDGQSTGVRNLNTAGIILEAALYRKLGQPFLRAVAGGGR